jgi:hypothetical protein
MTVVFNILDCGINRSLGYIREILYSVLLSGHNPHDDGYFEACSV